MMESSDFHKGMKQLLPERLPQNISILSIGSGLDSKVEIEIHALASIIGGTFNFVAVDAAYTKEDIARLKNRFNTSSFKCTFVSADASSPEILVKQGVKKNFFDLVILRHPDFATNPDAFRSIIRKTIPSFLKTGGLLVVSVFNEQETSFLVQGKYLLSIDTVTIAGLYNLSKATKHNNTDEFTLEKFNIASAHDKFMFCFKNRHNLNEANLQQYKCVSWQNYNYAQQENFAKRIQALGGCITNNKTGNFLCYPEYLEFSLLKEHGLNFELIQSLLIAADSPLSPSRGPLHQVNEQLASYRTDTSTKLFFEAFDKGNYNQALRRACTSNTKIALDIVKILVAHKDILNLDPYEAPGDAQKSAIDYAKEKGHPEMLCVLSKNSNSIHLSLST